MKQRSILFAVALMAGATPALAQDNGGGGGGASVGVTGGTLGIGPEVAYRFSNTVGIRGNVTVFGTSRGIDSDDISYNGKLKLRSGGAMIDVHPFGGGFRISAGARVSNNKVRLRATPTQDVEVGDEVYTPAEIGVLSGDVKANSFAPTLTLGWAGGKSRGFNFGFEAGGMFQGSPRIGNLRSTGTLATDAGFQASLRNEEREIENDVDQYKIYPIVQVMLGYRF